MRAVEGFVGETVALGIERAKCAEGEGSGMPFLSKMKVEKGESWCDGRTAELFYSSYYDRDAFVEAMERFCCGAGA